MARFMFILGLVLVGFGWWIATVVSEPGWIGLAIGIFFFVILGAFIAATSFLGWQLKAGNRRAKVFVLCILCSFVGAIFLDEYERGILFENQKREPKVKATLVRIVSEAVAEELEMSRRDRSQVEVIGIVNRPIDPGYQGVEIVEGPQQDTAVWVSIMEQKLLPPGSMYYRKYWSKYFLPLDSIELVAYQPGSIIKFLEQPNAPEIGELMWSLIKNGDVVSWEADGRFPAAPAMNEVSWFRTGNDEWKKIDPAWGRKWRSKIESDEIPPGDPL